MAATRRLAAIMFTDMVGSTESAQDNEALALRLRHEQASIIRPLFAAHQGREIKSMGDGFLAEFESALRAVQCGIDIQEHFHERNAQPGVTPIKVRIGIHLGDVEQHENDIFGDAVNIASRIEPLASPGGVCISGEVFSQIRNKISDKLEKISSTALKGVRVPVEIYAVMLPWTRASTPSDSSGPLRLAVLPFTNMSPDPADLYFADGLTEELITVLSHLRELRVIARTSVMQYKTTTKEVSEIGTNLGVAWVMEGSVRRAGNRLRITAQLIDAASQEHVWAKSFDRELDDVFVIQSEIAREVAEALKIQLLPSETARLGAKPSVQPESYLAYLKGQSLLVSRWSEEAFRGAKQQFELALSIDPTNARAHAGLADACLHLKWGRFLRPNDPGMPEIQRHVTRALELDSSLAEAHCGLAAILWEEWDNVGAQREYQRALALNPSLAQAHYDYGHLLITFARGEEALAHLQLSCQLDPGSVSYQHWLTGLLLNLRRTDEAAVQLERLRRLTEGGEEFLRAYGFYLYTQSKFEEVLQNAERLRDSEEAANQRIWAYSALGRHTEAWRLIEEAESQAEKPAIQTSAMWRALVGDLDGCFALLNQAADSNELAIQVWRLEPALGSVRADPRFAMLLKKMKIPSFDP